MRIIKKIIHRIIDYYYILFRYSSEGQLRVHKLQEKDEYDPLFNSYISFKKYQKKLRFYLASFSSLTILILISTIVVAVLAINVLVLFFSSGMTLQEWGEVFFGKNGANKATISENYFNQEMQVQSIGSKKKELTNMEGVEQAENVATKDDVRNNSDGTMNAAKEDKESSGNFEKQEENAVVIKNRPIKEQEGYYLITSSREWKKSGSDSYLSHVYEIGDYKKAFRFLDLTSQEDILENCSAKFLVATFDEKNGVGEVDWRDDCEVFVDSATSRGTLLNSSCIGDQEKYIQYKVSGISNCDSDLENILVSISWEEK